MCPEGLLSDGKGGCINETSCPCQHNGQLYQPGETLTDDCNTWFVQCLTHIPVEYVPVWKSNIRNDACKYKSSKFALLKINR